jgi:hypothetical protein
MKNLEKRKSNKEKTRTAWAVFKYCGTELHHQEG